MYDTTKKTRILWKKKVHTHFGTCAIIHFSQGLILVSITQNHECIIAYLTPMSLNVMLMPRPFESLLTVTNCDVLIYITGDPTNHRHFNAASYENTCTFMKQYSYHLFRSNIALTWKGWFGESFVKYCRSYFPKVSDMNPSVAILIVLSSYLQHMKMNII